MKSAVVLAAGSALALGLLGGTTSGATLAAWHVSSAVPGGTIDSGTLDVAVARADASSSLARKLVTSTSYTVTVTLVGDNLDAELVLDVADWADVDGAEVALAVEGPDGSIDADLRGETPVLRVSTTGPASTDEVPTAVVTDDRLAVHVTLTATQGDGSSAVNLPDTELSAELSQTRDAAPASDGLWKAVGSAPVDAVQWGGSVAKSSEPREAAPDAAQVPQTATPTAPSDDTTDAPATDAPTTEAPAEEPAPEPDPTEAADETDGAEAEKTPDPEKAPDAETTPEAETGPSDGADEKDDTTPADETGTPDEPEDAATPDRPEETAPEEKPAPADDDPAWAEDLLDDFPTLADDPASVDEDQLRAWAKEQDVPLDDVLDWLERSAS